MFVKLKPVVASIAVATALSFPSLTQADLSNAMGAVFDGYVSADGPDAYKSSLGTTISGGYVKFRKKRTSLGPIFDYKVPSFRGGCNGFDLFGGSMYVISGDRLITFLEQIAQDAANVAVYAFLTSLRQSCSVCDAVLNVLREVEDISNQFNRDSCEVGTKIVNALKPKNVKGKDGDAIFTELKDAFINKDDEGAESLAKAEAGGLPVAKAKELIYGNLMIYALVNNTDIGTLYGASSESEKKVLFEQIMSLYGSVIVSIKKQQDGKVKDVGYQDLSNILRFEDFYLGTDPSKKIKIYKCDGIPEKTAAGSATPRIGCLNVTDPIASENNSIKGMKEIIDEQFKGSDGILKKIEDGRDDFSDAQKQLLSNLNYYSKVTNLIVRLKANPALMRQFYEQNIDYISAMMAYGVLYDLEKSISATFAKLSGQPGVEKMEKQFNKAKVELHRDALSILSVGTEKDIYEKYRHFESQVEKNQ